MHVRRGTQSLTGNQYRSYLKTMQVSLSLADLILIWAASCAVPGVKKCLR
jgi:hypothetical protein